MTARRVHHPTGVAVPTAADLLVGLRAAGTGRSPVDPGLAGGLRAWLEDGAAAAVGARRPLRITPHHASGPWARERGGEGGGAARRLLARAVFRLVVTGCPPRHPFEDALCALSVTGAGDAVLADLQTLSRPARAALRGAVESDAASITAQWRRPPASWLARTAERLRVPLAAGAVTLEATADLALGTPSHGIASVCLVEVRAGATPPAEGLGRRFLALVETVRSGAPPCRVATYDPVSRSLTVDEVDEAMLVAAVGDVLGLVDRAGAPGASA